MLQRRAVGRLTLALLALVAGGANLGLGSRAATQEDAGNRRLEVEALLTTLRQESAICAPRTSSRVRQEAPSMQRESRRIGMRKSIVAATMMALAGTALAHEATTSEPMELAPEEIVFKDDPAFPKGAQTAVLHGDPAKPGLFILRLKFPANYVVPPHTHPGFETVTVLSGAMGSGMGEKADLTKGKMLEAGGMLALPANHVHYVWTTDKETIIQVAAVGPFDIIYTDPSEDPRKK